MALEEFVRENEVALTIGFAVNEINCHLFGGKSSLHRLLATVEKKIPLTLVPGDVDFINLLGKETIPEIYAKRDIYAHSHVAHFVRTNGSEDGQLGKALAEKLNRSKAKTLVLWSKRGLSSLEREGRAFLDPIADDSLLNSPKKGGGCPYK